MEIGTRRERIHIICDCAATALKYVPKGEDRPRLAIEAARKYADKKTNANLEKLNAAGTAAWAAGTATRAVGAAARAAWDAAGAAAWAAARDTAEDAAEAAAWTATWAATEDAADKKICNMIRKKISIKEI
jgi:hypothetical protein